jgi:hypothetical protein
VYVVVHVFVAIRYRMHSNIPAHPNAMMSSVSFIDPCTPLVLLIIFCYFRIATGYFGVGLCVPREETAINSPSPLVLEVIPPYPEVMFFVVPHDCHPIVLVMDFEGGVA